MLLATTATDVGLAIYVGVVVGFIVGLLIVLFMAGSHRNRDND